jgi:hypothetical protein
MTGAAERAVERGSAEHAAGSSSAPWIALFLLWAATVAAAFGLLWSYKLRPGEIGGTPSLWPSESRIPRRPGRATLVLFAHPKCPCTRASLAELARLMSRLGDRVSADVVFLRPPGVGTDWDQTDLWESASVIPGVTAVRDDGAETARFQAETSGLAVLYDAQGRLLFRGGITSARGHEGDSFGARRIVSFVRTGTADRGDAPVFGCALHHSVETAGRTTATGEETE